jgi:hypothetical protein
MAKKLPKELLVYVYDHADGEDLYAVARSVEEIPEDCDGELVGNYTLNRTSTFKVKRELT